MTLQPQHGNPESPQWIAIYITHDLQEAHIIKGKLGAYDIPAMIHKEAGAAAIGLTLGNLGEIKILVAPADYEKAEALLYPGDRDQIDASNDKIQLLWDDDGAEIDGDVDDE